MCENRTMRKVIAVALLVIAFAIAGCGGGSSSSGSNGEESKSGQQVVADAAKAAEAASSVHISGQTSGVGRPAFQIDMTIVKGKGAQGSVTIGNDTVDLMVIGEDTYIKAGAGFWSSFGDPVDSTVAPTLEGKWVKMPTTVAQLGPFATFTDSKSFFDALRSASGTFTNKGATTYKGQSVVAIDNQGTLYVANTGTPYPVAAVTNGSGEGGTITFDGWNEADTLTPPAGAIDLPGLKDTSASPNDGSGDGEDISIATGTPKVGNSGTSGLIGATDVAKLFRGIPQNGLVLGDPNAPVTLIEYIDLQCPICAQFETSELEPLIEKYVRRGKLKIKMQPWSILDRSPDVHDSDRGQKATIGAAAQNKAFNFAQVLYRNQGTEDTGWMNDKMISDIAASVDGLKPFQLATDANSAATQGVIASITNWANANPTEMTGTPTIYLVKGDGKPQWFYTGVPDLGNLEAAIDAQLE